MPDNLEFIDNRTYIGIMDHITFLIIALVALLLGNLPKYRFLSFVALGILIFDFATNFNFNKASDVLQFSIDLIIIAVLSAISQHLNKDWIKILFIPVAVGLLLSIHSISTNGSSDLDVNLKSDLFEDLEILVQLKEDVNITEWVRNNENKYDITYPLFNPKSRSSLLDEYVGINTKEGSNLKSIIEELESDKDVAYTELNEVLELKLPDSKPYKNGNRALQINDPKSGNQWAVDKMKLNDIHQLLNTKSNARNNYTLIAILDTGIEASHEDLKENYISTNRAYDRDVRGHGTHCAGIAAAVTGNNIGIASLLPSQSNIKVTSIKVLSNFGIGAQHQIIAGIIEAADKGADVISMSLGGPSTPDKEKAYLEAVKYANAQGAIVVVSAGNSNMDAAKYSPANTPGVITVAAVNNNLKKASFSNIIKNVKMGIAAPGQDIYSTFKGNSYAFQSGTSMASPFVAGLLGLMRSIDPDITTQEAYNILIRSSNRNDGLDVVNPLGAVQEMFK